jgi:hypothetical protein
MSELALSKRLKDKIFARCYNDRAIREDRCIGPDFFNRSLSLANDVFDSDPEGIALENKFTLPCIHRSLLYYKPGDDAKMHIDAMPGRISAMCWPVYPDTKYPPIFFWEKDQDGNAYKVASAGGDGVPFIFNATRLHSVEISSIPRINLQVSFYEPIELIAQLIKENRLFKRFS